MGKCTVCCYFKALVGGAVLEGCLGVVVNLHWRINFWELRTGCESVPQPTIENCIYPSLGMVSRVLPDSYGRRERGVYLSSRGVPECFAPMGLIISHPEFPTHITATLLLKKTAAVQQNIYRKKRYEKQLSCGAAI